MATHLTVKDCNELAEGPLQLSASLSSDRAFWAAVLLVATTDQASAVHYRLDLHENCLGVEIDGQTYFMEPPPPEFRERLLSAARRFASNNRFGYLVRRVHSYFNRSKYLGRIALEFHRGDAYWDVYEISRGVSIQRVKQVIVNA